ncbi:cell envelope integrity EipB family protein [Microvirga sp. ACRRW]|uniref:cell envelope integrity EipB family protein n=1 Tax=Microvirga sp. ACRRW TaxID=2918205 RepID=UPI001EF54CBF|nr:cell envelope integrity EipB family protein [Microvirga sp. ACRRW]MCG7394040.1 cell envelope integrity EipB family protein [Microvirga sp. ACRRW]
MRSLIVATSLTFAMLGSACAEAAETPVHLAPHRAVYDLSILRSGGSKGVESARGRIAMEFAGDACDGYTMKYRQVTVLDSSEAGSRTLDTQTATFESGDGLSMRFKSTSTAQGLVRDGVDGDAQLRPDGSLDVKFKQPRNETFAAKGQPVFPTDHMKRLIEAARKGERRLSARVYDGSDDGKKVYETLSLIGNKIEPGAGNNLEESARQDAMMTSARWPITISYFQEGSADRAPAYTISFELYENGVARALKIDYGDFALKGDLKSLEMPAVTSNCQR